MSEEYLSEGHDKTLSRRITRSVGRLLDDVRGFKKLPEFVGRVSQTTMREGIGLKNIAKLIVGRWVRDPHNPVIVSTAQSKPKGRSQPRLVSDAATNARAHQ